MEFQKPLMGCPAKEKILFDAVKVESMLMG